MADYVVPDEYPDGSYILQWMVETEDGEDLGAIVGQPPDGDPLMQIAHSIAQPECSYFLDDILHFLSWTRCRQTASKINKAIKAHLSSLSPS